MRKTIDRMLEDALNGKTRPKTPFVRGFVSRSARDDAEPRLVPLRVATTPPYGPEIATDEDHVYVTMELPDHRDGDLRVAVSGQSLIITASGSGAWRRAVDLPCDVEPRPIWTVHNAVLDIVLLRTRGLGGT